jgi:hypothetical protein
MEGTGSATTVVPFPPPPQEVNPRMMTAMANKAKPNLPIQPPHPVWIFMGEHDFRWKTASLESHHHFSKLSRLAGANGTGACYEIPSAAERFRIYVMNTILRLFHEHLGKLSATMAG